MSSTALQCHHGVNEDAIMEQQVFSMMTNGMQIDFLAA